MANLPISGLTASASNAAATDVLPVVQTTGTGPVKMTVQQMAGGLLGSTTISGATVTTSQPVLNLAQTWNNAAVTFTGLKFNVPTDTSASTSLLMDLQVGGTTKFVVDKAGRIRGDSSTNIQSYLSFDAGSGGSPYMGNFATSLVAFAIPYGYTGVQLYNTVPFGFVSSGNALTGTLDTILTRRGAANLRFGAADAAAPVAQTLSVQSVVAGTSNTAGANLTITGSQGTGTGAGGSIIFQVAPAGGSGNTQNTLATALQIVSTSATTTTFQFWQPSIGTARSVELITCDNAGLRVGGIISFAASGEVRFGAFNAGGYYSTFYSNNVERWQINTSGHLLAATDNTYDIGAAGATRPRDLFLGRNATIGGFVNPAYIRLITTAGAAETHIYNAGNGIFTCYDNAETSFNRIQLGGTTSSFPALKRSTTSLQARLADDSAFTNIQGKLTTDTAYVAGTVVPTGVLTLYDSTGTAYRVPCLV